MNVKKIKTLLPCFMNDFKCTGSSCEDNCCGRWNIYIDYETYKKYQFEENRDFKELFEKHTIMNGNPGSRDDYARIVLKQDLLCPFLTEERLCLVQLRKGSQYQPKVCRVFPRSYHIVDGILEESVTLACPEAARLALLNPEGITFCEDERCFDQEYYTESMPAAFNADIMQGLAKHFSMLRSFSIKVIQGRHHTLYERLIFLGRYFKEADLVTNNVGPDELPGLAACYTSHSSHYAVLDEALDMSPPPFIYVLDFLQLLSSSLLDKITNPVYSDLLSQILLGIGFSSSSNPEYLKKNFEEAFHSYYLPYIHEHEYILENYLVNQIFKTKFPLFPGDSRLFENYLKLIIHCCLIGIQLVGLSAFHKGLTTDLVVKLIQNYSKETDHNSNFLMSIYGLLNHADQTLFQGMLELIKSGHKEETNLFR